MSRGGRKRQHDLAANCHHARKSSYDGSRWSKLGAPPLYSAGFEPSPAHPQPTKRHSSNAVPYETKVVIAALLAQFAAESTN